MLDTPTDLMTSLASPASQTSRFLLKIKKKIHNGSCYKLPRTKGTNAREINEPFVLN